MARSGRTKSDESMPWPGFLARTQSRIAEITRDVQAGLETTASGLQEMSASTGSMRKDTEVLAASIRNPIHVLDAAKAGAHVATMPFNVLEMLMKHPLTDIGLKKFLEDWEKSGSKI